MSSSVLALIVPFVLLAVAAICIRKRKLTFAAGMMAWLTGICIYLGGGLPGLLFLAVFFVLATLATGHRKAEKALQEQSDAHPEIRRSGQVLANGGVASAISVLAFLHPDLKAPSLMMMAASLAAATADTLSSELGVVYGKRHYNILTFRKEARGLDGVVSLEGTLLGAGGAAVIAVVYAMTVVPDGSAWYVFAGGVLGNLVDSLLGASLERRGIIGNNMVNFFNTLSGAFIALALYAL
ncbi:DUF92 domain-containing protein [Chitinophaga pendula]|uniref:DUF92 domain-containing protein n=1 Tax=Chitinophaga TaxID=79328 RepID=UPI000BB0167C|nr:MULTISPECIES: DUF92 domain-containing protein [Chitinophaga]ASZ13647.1 hypothetical protein CK934_23185 [Chitinophaga sp. MD30]UCJ08727.1 DUF92 domain-containing protein [Chitinophaga pendula]